MLRRSIAALAIVVAVLVGGCSVFTSAPPVVGSGRPATEQRTVGSFTKVRVGAAIEATLIVGPDTSVSVTADDNVLSYVVTNVVGDRLDVTMQGSVTGTTKVTVAITAPVIDSVEANSAANLTATGIVADGLRAVAESAGVVIARGQATSVDVSSQSGATADLGGVPAQTANVSVASGGRAVVNASDSVGGKVESGGLLTIEGNPAQVNVTTDSSGQVVRD